jgi:hypothetical protein
MGLTVLVRLALDAVDAARTIRRLAGRRLADAGIAQAADAGHVFPAAVLVPLASLAAARVVGTADVPLAAMRTTLVVGPAVVADIDALKGIALDATPAVLGRRRFRLHRHDTHPERGQGESLHRAAPACVGGESAA